MRIRVEKICDLQHFLFDIANEAYADYKKRCRIEETLIPSDLRNSMYSFKRQSVTLERADEIFEMLDLDLSYRVKDKLIWHKRYQGMNEADWLEKFYGTTSYGLSLKQRRKLHLWNLQTFCETTGITYEFLLFSDFADFQWRFVYEGDDRTRHSVAHPN